MPCLVCPCHLSAWAWYARYGAAWFASMRGCQASETACIHPVGCMRGIYMHDHNVSACLHVPVGISQVLFMSLTCRQRLSISHHMLKLRTGNGFCVDKNQQHIEQATACIHSNNGCRISGRKKNVRPSQHPSAPPSILVYHPYSDFPGISFTVASSGDGLQELYVTQVHLKPVYSPKVICWKMTASNQMVWDWS